MEQYSTTFAKCYAQSPKWEKSIVPAFQRIFKIKLNSHSKILDLGCGSGDLIPIVNKFGVNKDNYIGIDSSEAMIKIAKQRYAEYTFYNEFAQSFCDKYELGNAFDLVVSSMVFCVFTTPKELFKAFEQVSLTLKTGGSFVLLVPHPLNDPYMQNKSEATNYFKSGEIYCSKKKLVNEVELVFSDTHWLIGDYVSAAAKSGLLLEAVDECYSANYTVPYHIMFTFKKC